MIEMPARIARLPRQAGYPVPWFVEWIGGVAEFRAADGRKLVRAVKERRCWVCGDILGRYLSFLIGPMCAVNRISSEPPSHRECAEYSAQACPFLSNPGAVRRETKMPEGVKDPAGVMIRRNPAVTLVWNTELYDLMRVDNGVLFRIGPPTSLSWWREGRTATRAEILDSIESGLPSLREPAVEEGPEAVAALEKMLGEAMELLPA